MRGAERSLVTVGRSFTVAKGFVPLWGAVRKAQAPGWLWVQGGAWAPESMSPRPYYTHHPTSPTLVCPHSPPLSPVPSDPCWLEDSPGEELWGVLLPGHKFLQWGWRKGQVGGRGASQPLPGSSPCQGAEWTRGPCRAKLLGIEATAF